MRLEPLPPNADMATDLQRSEPLNIFRTLAHNPELMRKAMSFGNRFLFKGNRLDPRVREIMILRSAWRTGSVYEFGQHTLIGRKCGLSQAEIARLASSDVGAWPDDEGLLITVVDELSVTDTVTDGTWARLRELFDEPTIVEILLLPGFYRMLAGFLNATGVEREADTPGWPA
jgi:4-carboxymuconolactone decarboxylase